MIIKGIFNQNLLFLQNLFTYIIGLKYKDIFMLRLYHISLKGNVPTQMFNCKYEFLFSVITDCKNVNKVTINFWLILLIKHLV